MMGKAFHNWRRFYIHQNSIMCKVSTNSIWRTNIMNERVLVAGKTGHNSIVNTSLEISYNAIFFFFDFP